MSDNSLKSKRHTSQRAYALLLCCILILGTAGCSSTDDNNITLTGSFVSDTVTISVPTLPHTPANLFIGTEPSVEGTPGASVGGELPAAALEQPITSAPSPGVQSWQRIIEVSVSTGDMVVAGQVIATLDDSLAQATAQTAQADLARSEAELALIDEMSGDVKEGRSEVESQTAELNDTVNDLRTQRLELQAQLDAARIAAAPSSNTTTPTPVPPSLLEQIARLEAAISQIEAGIEQADAGLEEIASAEAELADVESTLGTIRNTAFAVVKGRRAAVELAQGLAGLAQVKAPVDGIVVDIAGVGEILASGAPLAEVRTSSRPRVSTYLTAEQVRRVRDGSSARVSLDSIPGTEYTGLITEVSDVYAYVPTSFSTDIIHMTRGFKVTVEVYGAPDLPPGTPADLVIQTD